MPSTGSNSSAQETEAATARADVVVGVTSYNDVRTIGAVTHAVRDGLAQCCPSVEARLVLADAGSNDGTREAARDAAGVFGLVELQYEVAPQFQDLPYHGHPGRAAALRAILQTAQRLDARACAVIDAGVQTVLPAWIDRFVSPVLTDGFDYVSPYYPRQAHEGAITKSIVYPMFRALYGLRLRQPAAAEFGCSGRLVTHLLEQTFWEADQAPVAIDIWLAIAAASADFRACEAALGVRETARGVPTNLSTTLAQVVGALFADLEQRVDVWQRVRGSMPTPLFGVPTEATTDAAPPDTVGLVESFRLGYRELREIWTFVLPPRTIVELRKLTETPADRFRIDDRLWATIVYDFALGYAMRVMPHDHLLRSLTPLYTGWLASFILQIRTATPAEIESRVDQVCAGFEAEKRYLIARWRWPERLR